MFIRTKGRYYRNSENLDVICVPLLLSVCAWPQLSKHGESSQSKSREHYRGAVFLPESSAGCVKRIRCLHATHGGLGHEPVKKCQLVRSVVVDFTKTVWHGMAGPGYRHGDECEAAAVNRICGVGDKFLDPANATTPSACASCEAWLSSSHFNTRECSSTCTCVR